MNFLQFIPFIVSASAFAQQVVPPECYKAISRNAWGTNSTINILAKCTIDFTAGGTIAFKGDHTGTPWGTFPGGWMDFINIPEGYLYKPSTNDSHILNNGDTLILEYSAKTAATHIALYTGANPPPPPVPTYGVLQFTNSTGYNFTAHLNNEDNPQDIVINGTDLTEKTLVGKYYISIPPLNNNGKIFVITAEPNPVILAENQTVNVSFSAKEIVANKIFFPYIETSALTDPTQPKPNGWLYPFSKLSDLVPIGIYNVTLAFVLSDGKCGGDFYSQNYNANLKEQISAFQASGGRVIASLGGANGPYIEEQFIGNHCNVPGEHKEVTLAKAYEKFIDKYNIRYLDFDIEGSAISNTSQVDLRNKAIAVLLNNPKYADVKISYTLPVLPTGVLENSIHLLKNANTNKVVVDRINIMTMDYGAEFPPNRMGDNAIQAAESLHKQITPIYPNASSTELYNKIGITPMIGYNDVRPEVFTLADASQVYIYAQTKGIGLLSFWSLNRDHACESGTVSGVCSGIPTQQPFDFAKKFLGQ
ncbi:chitinase [Fluviispira vulneris]|uniref:chitinase n=1 Tax=Fluviispira vulneris TaxID=2763012 RepID=UPI0016479948|nr:chitinase [Fluviispira vulneris]